MDETLGYSKENLKIRTRILSTFFPSPVLPSISLPFLCFPLPLLLFSSLQPSLFLRSKVPFIPATVSGERNQFWCILALKSDV